MIHNCSASEKEDKLVELLTGLPSEASIMIFCNKKRDCEYISAGAMHFRRPEFSANLRKIIMETAALPVVDDDAPALSFSAPANVF